MGKAADNERLKLRAAYYNNLATGVVITGYAVPYFALMKKTLESPPAELTSLLTQTDVLVLTGLWLLALLGASMLRGMTNRILARIAD